MKGKQQYVAPSVEVILCDPEGCLCSSGIGPDAHNELSTSRQMDHDSWASRIWDNGDSGE